MKSKNTIARALCLHMDVQVRGENIRCLLGKYRLEVVKLKDCKMK